MARKLVRCSCCYVVKEPAEGVKYNTMDKQSKCECGGWFRWLDLYTTPDRVKASRDALEADRKRKSRSDAAMTSDRVGTAYHVPYGQRLMDGFRMLKD